MSWFRVDCDMIINPKVGELSDAEFRDLIALWSYCKRRDNGGEFHARELKNVSRASQEGAKRVPEKTLRRLQELQFVIRKGRTGEVYKIKDWLSYQPKDATAADRMRRYRARNVTRNDRNADRNGAVTTDIHTDIRTTSLSTSTVDVAEPKPETEWAKQRESENRKSDQRGAGWIENLSGYTGCRMVRGEMGTGYRRDVLGTDRPPQDWPHPRPTKQEIRRALDEREAAPA